MPHWTRTALLALAATAGLACALAGSGTGPTKATRLTLRESAFDAAEIVAAKSLPPQFEVVLERQMPTPGWHFEIDAVEVDADEGRIRARLTESGPAGMTSQVITRTTLRLPLGTLDPGAWLLELWLRGDPDSPHQLAQAFVLDAY